VLEDLLRALTLNVLIGNGDAHAKNFSLLLSPSGALRLSPLYDLLCTVHYGDDRLAMSVDGLSLIAEVTPERIVKEATRWGISRTRAAEAVDDILTRAPEAIAAARDETTGLPESIEATVLDRLTQLRSHNTP
jgi:serine/threonine-protein kinase HipA